MNERLHRATLELLKDQKDLISLSKITFNEDGIACIPEPPLKSNQHFAVMGRRFYVQMTSDGKKGLCEIWGPLGQMPYSAENPEQRKTLLHILRRSREQKKVQFVLSQNQDIIVTQRVPMDGAISPITFLSALYGFIHDAMPLVLLVTGYTMTPKTKKTEP